MWMRSRDHNSSGILDRFVAHWHRQGLDPGVLTETRWHVVYRQPRLRHDAATCAAKGESKVCSLG
jgi:hypothetical protein